MYRGKTIFTIFSVTALLVVVFATLFFVSKNSDYLTNNVSSLGTESVSEVNPVLPREETEVVVEVEKTELREDVPILYGEIIGGTDYYPEGADFVDVFITSGYFISAGKDSRTGELLESDGTISYSEDLIEISRDKQRLIKTFSIDELSEHGDTMTVSIVGLSDGQYTFSGTFLDENRVLHEFSYSLLTEEGFAHEFEFRYGTGEVTIDQDDYSYLFNHDYEDLISEQCDVSSLEQKLLDVMKEHGWDLSMKDRISGKIEIPEARRWPGIFDEVCTLTVSFIDDEEEDYSSLFNNLRGDFEEFDVNGHVFNMGYGDGTYSSSISAPVLVDETHVQQLEFYRVDRSIRINLPVEQAVCPCYREYIFSITEPVYVEPGEE